MFHATLQITAARLENRMSGIHIESRHLTGECIRLLNIRVRDLLNISDQTIGAVAILATVEVRSRVINLCFVANASLVRKGQYEDVQHASFGPETNAEPQRGIGCHTNV